VYETNLASAVTFELSTNLQKPPELEQSEGTINVFSIIFDSPGSNSTSYAYELVLSFQK
jgi:hypothetical protein